MNRDNHPVDILRPFVLSKVVEEMGFKSEANLVRQEAEKDLQNTQIILIPNVLLIRALRVYLMILTFMKPLKQAKLQQQKLLV